MVINGCYTHSCVCVSTLLSAFIVSTYHPRSCCHNDCLIYAWDLFLLQKRNHNDSLQLKGKLQLVDGCLSDTQKLGRVSSFILCPGHGITFEHSTAKGFCLFELLCSIVSVTLDVLAWPGFPQKGHFDFKGLPC